MRQYHDAKGERGGDGSNPSQPTGDWYLVLDWTRNGEHGCFFNGVMFQALVWSGVRMKIPSSEAGLILILNCTLKKVVKDRVADYVSKNRCLGTKTVEKEVDGEIVYIEIDCDKPVHNRGRCKECYDDWYNERRSMTDQEKVQFDHALIELGRLLAQQGKRLYAKQNLLARLARKVKKRA